jgi:hypothetical protein
MNQYQLDRAVAAATGEAVCTIQHMGFQFVQVPWPRRVFVPARTSRRSRSRRSVGCFRRLRGVTGVERQQSHMAAT